MNRFFLLLSFLCATNAFYTVNYFGLEDCSKIVNTLEFPADSTQIADIYSRLSGSAPLIREETLNLPAFDVFTTAPSQKLLIVEINTESLPVHSCPVVKSNVGPELKSVDAFLQSENVATSGLTFDLRGKSSASVVEFLQKQTQPVLILNHGVTVNTPRALAGTPTFSPSAAPTPSTSTVTPLTEFEISQYQVKIIFKNNYPRKLIIFLLLPTDLSMECHWIFSTSVDCCVQCGQYGGYS
jgi:hypothetical protein